jgi:hypothetical protein
MNNFIKVPYEMGKKTVGKIRRMNVKGAVNTASNIALGAGVVSMIPLSASPSTDKDIERMKQYKGKELGDRS